MHHYFITDFETGGLEFEKNPITEVAIIVVEPSKLEIVEEYTTYVQPYNNLTITQAALDKSQSSMHEINAGINSTALLKKMIELAKKYNGGNTKIPMKPIFVGHNFSFDIDFAEYLFKFHNKNLYDFFDRNFECTQRTLKKMEFTDKKLKNKYNLTACCSRYGIDLKSAHGALADTFATYELFKVITQRLRNKDTNSVNTNINKTENTRQKARKFYQF